MLRANIADLSENYVGTLSWINFREHLLGVINARDPRRWSGQLSNISGLHTAVTWRRQ